MRRRGALPQVGAARTAGRARRQDRLIRPRLAGDPALTFSFAQSDGPERCLARLFPGFLCRRVHPAR
ncbi:hypothetical protein CO2235_10002 [Cupriavidus oxalaticus]|uniref:Uncharacterized protein n=1 Tax=Cupriavidus oxalaticus TaxID=96344 RepID=A0A375FVW6_9BURK|nr:hypothetical protein CO2235_10002 [Cupriavidus oxalaticus]